MLIDPAIRAELERVASAGLAHVRAGTFPQTDAGMVLDATTYTDPVRFDAEIARIFRRVPLMLAAACELPRAGDYKAMDVAGVPVLLVRGGDGRVRAMVNGCTHRGAMLAEGCGHAARFTCPYHGWTFTTDGKLAGVAAAEDFGAVDKAALGLVQLPAWERAGLVWVVLDPASTLDIDAFLGPFGAMLDCFGLAGWHCIDRRSLPGTNWKLAHDAHADWYHLPVLHRESFGPQAGNRAHYTSYGPHLRMFRPMPEVPPPPPEQDVYRLQDRPSADWPVAALLTGGWLAFPNLTMYALYRDGHRFLNINQILPGGAVGESTTIQIILAEAAPSPDLRRMGLRMADMIEQVVRDEDLPNSARQQRALRSGLLPEVRFGRNEGGNQHFHRWFDRVVAASDQELGRLWPATE